MKKFEYKVEIISTYKLESTLEYMGRHGWELVTTSIKDREKEDLTNHSDVKILLIFKKEKK